MATKFSDEDKNSCNREKKNNEKITWYNGINYQLTIKCLNIANDGQDKCVIDKIKYEK